MEVIVCPNCGEFDTVTRRISIRGTATVDPTTGKITLVDYAEVQEQFRECDCGHRWLKGEEFDI